MSISKYIWFEYLKNLEGKLNAVKEEIQALKDHIEYLELEEEAFLFFDEIKGLLKNIGASYNELKDYNELKENDILEAKYLPELRYLLAGAMYYYHELKDNIEEVLKGGILKISEIDRKIIILHNLLNRLEELLAYVKYGLDQLMGCENLRQNVFYSYSFTYPSMQFQSIEKVLKAVTAVVNNYVNLIIGKDWLKNHGIRPIAIAGFRDYAISTQLYIAKYPIVDTFRSRFWVAFGHEVQHEKNYLFRIIIHRSKIIEKIKNINYKNRGDYRKVKRFLDKKIKLMFGKKEYFEEAQNLWNYLAKELYNYYNIPYAHELLDEIVSDISNTLLSGPSDFLSLLSIAFGYIWWTWNYREYDEHPPLFIRYEYCERICKDVLKLKKFFEDYREVLNNLEEEFFNYCNLKKLRLKDFEDCQDYKHECLTRKDIYESYVDFKLFVECNLDDLVELTKLLIRGYIDSGKSIFFDKKKYEQAVNIKDKVMEGKFIQEISKDLTGDEYGIEPRVVLMAGWLKRLDDFRNIEERGGDISTIEKYDKSKTRMYPVIVDYLEKWYSKNIRRW